MNQWQNAIIQYKTELVTKQNIKEKQKNDEKGGYGEH